MTERKKLVSRTLAILMMACMVIFGTAAMTATTYANEGGGIEFQKGGEAIDEDMLFSDEEIEYSVNYDEEDAISDLNVEVFYQSYDYDQDEFENIQLSDEVFSYDDADQTITMYGEQCWNELVDPDDSFYVYDVTVSASYVNADGDDVEALLPLSVRESYVKYEYPWNTEELGDDLEWTMYGTEERSIYNTGEVSIQNRDYPNGEWLDYEVTNVTSDNKCISVSREDDESNWVVRAEKEGQAKLTIEYQTIDSDVDTFTVDIDVKDVIYGVGIERTDEGGDTVLPGSEIEFEAYGYRLPEIEENEEEYEYHWSVEGKATIKTDDQDSSCAKVTVDEDAVDGDTVEVKVIMKNGDGDILVEDIYELEVLSEYDEFFISDVNDYALVGESQKITAEYRHYDMDTPYGVKKDRWTVTCTNVDPAGAATVRSLANDLNGNFEITRKSAEEFEVEFTAKFDDGEDEETRTIYFKNSPSTNLSDWDLTIFDENDDQVDDRLYVDGKDGETRLSSIILRWDGEIDLDYNKYDLTMEKESIGPDGNLIYTPVRIGDKLQPGKNGTTTYRITAKAKAGSGFTGSCFRYMDVCDRYSLNGFNADVRFEGEGLGKPNAVGERPMRDYYLVLMDDLSGIYPEVSIDDGNLVPDDYYSVSYVLESQEDDPNAPVYYALDEITEPGVYVCRITGIDPYYGTSDTVALNVVENQDAYDAAENAYAFSDMIEEIIASIFNGESLDTVKKTTADARSMLKGEGPDALTPAAIAAVPERVKGMLTSAEKYIEFKETVKTIDPANPKQDAVQKARNAYNAIQNWLKDAVATADLNRLTSAEKKIADDKAAADARAAAEAKAKMVKTVTINVKTVNAKAVNSAVQKAGGSSKYVTKFVLGKKVKSIKKGAFTSYKKATTLELKTKKLKKKTVKNSLKGTKVKTVKVNVGSKKVNKKFVKTYKKIFTKKIVGKKVKIK